MDINQVFEQRKEDSRWNTSYPLSPLDWAPYRVSGPLSFEGEKTLSFYIHIPFCRQLCSFCEYSRMLCPSEDLQRKYLDTLRKDIGEFLKGNDSFEMKGFDIGGGTPTSLSEENFAMLLDIFVACVSRLCKSEDFEPSIEATFNTLSESKLTRIVQSGIHRLSLGVQSTAHDVLCSHHRERLTVGQMSEWMQKAWKAGIKKINLDLMYGLKGQTLETIMKDLEVIAALHPQQVTLYELRTNMIKDKEIPTKEELYFQYKRWYDGLLVLGYKARFGQNTFSLDETDMGVSSYLRSRMRDGVPYKGFGLSAQSMSHHGVSYNLGKTSSLSELLQEESYGEEYTYALPASELASKYIAIAGYNGSFSLAALSTYLQEDSNLSFQKELELCLREELLSIEGDRLFITEKGFRYYGAVFSLFHSRSIE